MSAGRSGRSTVGTPVPTTTSFDEVVLPTTTLRALRRHGEEGYPEEVCGLLLGPSPGPASRSREVSEVRGVPNRKQEERTHRFLIPSEDLRAAERDLEGTDQVIVGFYHSHPDHPARPSPFDQDHAWPWYAYLVLGVDRGTSRDLGAFELHPEERVFQPRRLRESPGGGP